MECKAYLDNPCKASSLPFWKTNAMEIPKGIRILLDEDLQSVDTDEYTDEKYFKLIHRLNGVERPLLDSDFRMDSGFKGLSRQGSGKVYCKRITMEDER